MQLMQFMLHIYLYALYNNRVAAKDAGESPLSPYGQISTGSSICPSNDCCNEF